MTTQYKLQKDVAGYNGFGLQFSDLKYSATLAANTEATLTVPSKGSMGAALDTVNKFIAVIQVKANISVWLAMNATAAVPAGATFALTTSDLIIGGEYYGVEVKAGEVMHFITPTASTEVMVKFYALPAN